METVFSIWELPTRPAIYAFYGSGPVPVPIFIGVAEALRPRVVEQLVTSGGGTARNDSALAFRPDWIDQLRWWEHADFDDRHALRAAEFVASDLLDPLLRSRIQITEQSRRLYEDERFREAMRALFTDPPAGSLRFPTVSLVLERLATLEGRLSALERAEEAKGAVHRAEMGSRRVDL